MFAPVVVTATAVTWHLLPDTRVVAPHLVPSLPVAAVVVKVTFAVGGDVIGVAPAQFLEMTRPVLVVRAE